MLEMFPNSQLYATKNPRGNRQQPMYLSMNPVEKLVVTYNRNAKNKTNFYIFCDKNQTIASSMALSWNFWAM